MFEPPAVVIDRHESVLVEGPDAERFLQGLLSQDVAALASGAAARSFLLSPQGKLVALLWVARESSDRFALIADAGLGQNLVQSLLHYRFRVKATVEIDTRAVYMLIDKGGGIESRASEGGGARPAEFDAPLPGWRRRFLLGTPPVAPAAPDGWWDAVRIEAGEPIMGVDVDENTIPQESGLVVEAVSFEKGCYLGQELVARIDTRGHVNRLLRGLVFSEATPPNTGAAVVVGGKEVGLVTSASRSERWESFVGLGVLHRSVEPGTQVEIAAGDDRRAATVLALPMTKQP